MNIEDEFTVSREIDQVFKEINNIGDIGYCIAGVREVRTLSQDESDWTIEVRAGFMARTFRIRGLITERRPAELLAFTGTAPEVQIAGRVALSAVDAATTTCTVTIDIEVTGAFRSLVDQMAKGPQQKLVRETIANLRERLDVSTGPVVAGDLVPGHQAGATVAPARGSTGRTPWWSRRRRRAADLAGLELRLQGIETQLVEIRALLEELKEHRPPEQPAGPPRPPVYRKTSKARPITPGTRTGP